MSALTLFALLLALEIGESPLATGRLGDAAPQSALLDTRIEPWTFTYALANNGEEVLKLTEHIASDGSYEGFVVDSKWKPRIEVVESNRWRVVWTNSYTW